MRHLVLLALLAACASDAHAKKAKKPACTPIADAKIATAQAAAAKATAAAFDAAMKKAGLTFASIPRQELLKHEGLWDPATSTKPRPVPRTPGEPFTDTINGVKGTYIAGPTWWTGAPAAPPEIELVADDQGKLYRLRRANASMKTTTFEVCECQPYDCGSGCPACHDTVEVVYGPIPDGMTWKGEIAVTYDVTSVSLQYTRQCQVTCPP